ncbi:MAG: hypothetical protein ACP6IU_12225 [Candidatus Asgardarchaeia archaeon]
MKSEKKISEWLVVDAVIDFSLPTSAFYAPMIPLKPENKPISSNDKIVVSYYFKIDGKNYLIYRIFMDIKIAIMLKYLLDIDVEYTPKRTRTLFLGDVAITRLIDTPPLIHTPNGSFSFFSNESYFEFAKKLSEVLEDQRFSKFIADVENQIREEYDKLKKSME